MEYFRNIKNLRIDRFFIQYRQQLPRRTNQLRSFQTHCSLYIFFLFTFEFNSPESPTLNKSMVVGSGTGEEAGEKNPRILPSENSVVWMLIYTVPFVRNESSANSASEVEA